MILDAKTLGDLICILNGQFSPLNTFMTENNWKNVCENLHLTDNTFFPSVLMHTALTCPS